MLAIFLACLHAAPPSAPPAEWLALVERLADDDAGARRKAREALSGLDEDAIPFLYRCIRPGTDVDARLALYAAAGAIRERHWGLIRAMGPGAALTHVTHGYWFNRVRFTPDGRHAVVAGGAIMLFDLATGKEVRRVMEVGGARLGLEITPDGKHALTGHGAQLHADLVELPSLKPVRKFAGHEGGSGAGMRDVALSPDGRLAATCALGGLVLLHDVKTGEETARIAVRGIPLKLAFSPDGRRLLVAGRSSGADAQGRLWTFGAATGKPLAALVQKEGVAGRPLFLPDGERALVGTGRGHVVMLRLSDGKELRRMDHRDSVNDLALSPDGLRVASCGHHGRLIRVWDVEGGRLLHTLEGHMSPVLGVAFSPDGTRLLSCDAAACLRLWKVGRR